MKKLFLLVPIAVFAVLAGNGCSSSEADVLSEDSFNPSALSRSGDGLRQMTVEEENVCYTAIQHLTVVNGQFVLNLTEDEALSLGISNEYYNLIVTDLISANNFAQEVGYAATDDELCDAQRAADEYIMVRDSVGDLEDPIYPTNKPRRVPGEVWGQTGGCNQDNNSYTYTIYVPAGCRSISFNMQSNWLFAMGYVGIYYGGSLHTSGLCFSWFCQSGSMVLIPPVTGQYIQIVTRFTNGYGGYWSCTYNY